MVGAAVAATLLASPGGLASTARPVAAPALYVATSGSGRSARVRCRLRRQLPRLSQAQRSGPVRLLLRELRPRIAARQQDWPANLRLALQRLRASRGRERIRLDHRCEAQACQPPAL